MTEATATSHLSIGEVLSLVQEDFPDVTISKIRFLESQGLIAPERTGSGYRKFYDADIDRLRWILRQQRDHFLPLKVIKKMLDDGVDLHDSVESQPTLWSSEEPDEGAPPASSEAPDESPSDAADPEDDADADARASYRSPSHPAVASSPRARRAESTEPRPGTAAAAPSAPAESGPPPSSPPPAPVAESMDSTPTSSDVPAGPVDVVAEGRERARAAGIDPSVVGERPTADRPTAGREPIEEPGPDDGPVGDVVSERPAHSTPADVVAALQEDPRSARRARKAAARAEAETAGAERPDDPAAPADPAAPTARPSVATPTPPLSALLSAEELCELCGLTPELLAGLEQYGLVVPASLGGRSAYDAEAVEVARIAARYAELGVEPRHLRMYKISAEREAGFIEQLVVPLIKQRNPAARQQAVDRCDELIAMGADLHSALLRRQLGRILGT